ncbi:beta-glucosidase [Jatrophihabitans sp. GAS493]|uniref:glycoside hydrolase family 1 protein n=1 Tax=Jatrophihabitans sp. GAS493 TaxID=1907575 RepID=UPI000BB6E260|nr:beta-glucosidase [Jatrophihabitans sp. GAS493]SOD75157.1 beta-glucosidase [Jatrophihabitans sp. GAS493]
MTATQMRPAGSTRSAVDVGSTPAARPRPGALRTAFPPGFVWGAATAAYQIEGAVAEDGRGPSIWDTFSHTPGRVIGNETGDTAADHYHRVPDDVALMASLGLQAYRFSVAWSRIVPTGSGAVNRQGLDFYSRLVDELLSHHIDPVVTLYHWDLPQPLEDLGGWANRDTASRFAEYAQIIGQELGDRVRVFGTLNEPWCSAFLGYASGVHAPGRTDLVASLMAAHHLNLAHGLGTSALRAVLPADSQISITLNLHQVRPATQDPADVDAARSVDTVANRIFLDPILRGAYPQELYADTADVTDWSFVQATDLYNINKHPDLLGVNYYTPALIAALGPQEAAQITKRWTNDPQGADEPSIWPGSHRAYSVPQAGPYTDMGWRIEPEAFTELLLRVHRDYPGVAMMITENGAAFPDVVGEGGIVHDQDRIDYLESHLLALSDAIEAGADVRAYFVWSLMDNFEWAWGYGKRFGIVHVDYESQVRTPKSSAQWYHAVSRVNGIV